MSAAELHLSWTVGLGPKMTISNVFSSTFSDLTFDIASLFAKAQDSHPFHIFYLFLQLLESCALHQEYCSALAPRQDV